MNILPSRVALLPQSDGSWALPPGFIPCVKCRLRVFNGRPERAELAPWEIPAVIETDRLEANQTEGIPHASGAVARAQFAKLLTAVAPHIHCEDAHDAP